MTFHRFAIGETVAANGFGIPPGPYRIVRLLPLAGGVPQYGRRGRRARKSTGGK